jgi:putative ABC transport system permease protein
MAVTNSGIHAGRSGPLLETAMNYSLQTIWYERSRFLPGVIAVTFSALVMFVPSGILLGLFSQTSTPVDRSAADIWVSNPQAKSVDLPPPRTIPESWLSRVAEHPEIERAEIYLLAMVILDKKNGQTQTCTLIGTRLDEGSLGLPLGSELTPDVRVALGELGTFAADAKDLKRLGLQVGDEGEIYEHRVRLVGLVSGFKSLATPYLFCSLETARMLKSVPNDRVMFILGKCKDGTDPARVVAEINATYPRDMKAFTKKDFSARTRTYWLQTAQVATATLVSAALGLLVGTAVTGLILYSSTAASQREYAVLQALGIPRWRMATAVMAQAAWVGGVGVVLALSATWGVGFLADAAGLRMQLSLPILLGGAGLTMAIALLSGLFALWAIRLIEPAKLLR